MNTPERFSPKELANKQETELVDLYLKNGKKPTKTPTTRKSRKIPMFSDQDSFEIFKEACQYMHDNNIIDRYFTRFINALDYFGWDESDSYKNWQKYLKDQCKLSHSSFVDAFVGWRTIQNKEKGSIIKPLALPSRTITYKEWINILQMCFMHNTNPNTNQENQHRRIILTSLGDKILDDIYENGKERTFTAKPNGKSLLSTIPTGKKRGRKTGQKNNPKFQSSITEEQLNQIPNEKLLQIEKEINEEFPDPTFSPELEFKNSIKQILSQYYIIGKRVFSTFAHIPGSIFSLHGIKLYGYTFIMFPEDVKWSGELVVLSNTTSTSFKYLIDKNNKIII